MSTPSRRCWRARRTADRRALPQRHPLDPAVGAGPDARGRRSAGADRRRGATTASISPPCRPSPPACADLACAEPWRELGDASRIGCRSRRSSRFNREIVAASGEPHEVRDRERVAARRSRIRGMSGSISWTATSRCWRRGSTPASPTPAPSPPATSAPPTAPTVRFVEANGYTFDMPPPAPRRSTGCSAISTAGSGRPASSNGSAGG